MQAYKKRLISIIIAVVMAVGVFAPAVSAAELSATPTTSAVLVNGFDVAFDAYKISGNNYFKLRDLAYALSGTEKQFEVEWDAAKKAIRLTSGRPYTPVGGEMASKGVVKKTPKPTASKIILDGQEVSFTAYNIDDNNYFKLRDIGEAFDFGVGWDEAKNTITIDTSKKYAETPGAYDGIFDWATPVPTSRLLEYYRLSYDEWQIYHKIAAGIENFEMEIETTWLDSETSLRILYVLTATRPDLFWWVDSWSFQGFASGRFIIRPNYIVEGKEVCIRQNDDGSMRYPTENEIAEAKAGISRGKEKIRGVLEKLPVNSKMTPYELALAVNDWICDNVVYTNTADRQVRTIYGALVNSKANCAGFSSSFLLAMNLLGIECLVVFGKTAEDHQWNAVKLDGDWYHADVTFNQSFDLEYGNRNNYYMNRTDEFMTKSGYMIGEGFPERVNPNITCKATQHNYNQMEIYTLNGTNPEGIKWTYTGQLAPGGIWHGKGRMEWANGDWYEGDFDNGNRTGYGTYTWANGDKYEGELLNGKRHGRGTQTNADGTVISGYWVENNFVG